ncbi:hypothetical protein AGMMS50256_23070 [Betaproteobacteria bacterium]|nr:hypothetical protein AGMMS50256_23070 [Betaproteobacteria bacterium]
MSQDSMSHIRGPLTWKAEGVFHRAWKEPSTEPIKLVLELVDGTKRAMKLDWKEAAITEQKILALRPGVRIRLATWGNWSPDEWFCDVEEVK